MGLRVPVFQVCQPWKSSVSFSVVTQPPARQPTCAAAKRLLQNALYVAGYELCSALTVVQYLLVGIAGQAGPLCLQPCAFPEWARHVFACPRKFCLECNSSVTAPVASLPLDFVYRRRGVLCNLAKNSLTQLYISFKGSVHLTAALI